MTKFDVEEFASLASRVREKAKVENRLMENPSDEELRLLCEKEAGVRKTLYDNLVFESEPTSRAAPFTKNSIDQPFGKEEQDLLAHCEDVLAKERLISVDRTVGDEENGTTVRLIVPEKFAHVAYGGRNLFSPAKNSVKEPTYQVIFFADEAFEANKSKPLPEKDITIRLAMMDDGRVVKIVRNSNYIGEYKKGVFAAENWEAKDKKGGIFLHAGCREDFLQSVHGDYRAVRTLLLALSANGKTTLTCKILAWKSNEKSWLIQDDGGTLMPDGSFHGFEAGGLFVKTEGVNPAEQIEIYYGLLKPQTVSENVAVVENGDFDFFDIERTSNGRAVIRRKDIMHASQKISVPQIDNLILITRSPIIPAISKLTLEQAVAMMITGMAMESSAGDPTQAGKIKSEFFYDPFVTGDRAAHANRFYDILRTLPHVNYYIINTGGVGEGIRYKDIRVSDTLAIFDSLVRGGLEEWVDSPTGFKVPSAIRHADEVFLHPEKLYTHPEYEEKLAKLNKVIQGAIEKLGNSIHPDIRKSLGNK
ncbi:MAG: phosphoenolpyruvate carboxykinase [Candidatus Hydrothermarchaeales archaeon]